MSISNVICMQFLSLCVAIFQNLLRREPLKLVDGGESQRTFIYIKDAIEAVLLMIVSVLLANTILCAFRLQTVNLQ